MPANARLASASAEAIRRIVARFNGVGHLDDAGRGLPPQPKIGIDGQRLDRIGGHHVSTTGTGEPLTQRCGVGLHALGAANDDVAFNHGIASALDIVDPAPTPMRLQ